MKRIAQFACISAISAAAAAASGSTMPNPTLGYTATGGRGLGLKLANEDGSAATEVYRFVNGAHFDLSSKSQHQILIIDNRQVLLSSWTVGPRGITASQPLIVYGGPARANAAAFSQDGSKIAYYTDDGYVTVVTTATLQQVARFATESVGELSWMPDGNSVVALVMVLSGSSYVYQLAEYQIADGSRTVLLTEPSINDFDTGRVPGDRNLLVSYSNGPNAVPIGVWDGTQMHNLPAFGSAVNWNCSQTRSTLKSSADESVYTFDTTSGAKQLLYKGVQGRFPRYMKCDQTPAALAIAQRSRPSRFVRVVRRRN